MTFVIKYLRHLSIVEKDGFREFMKISVLTYSFAVNKQLISSKLFEKTAQNKREHLNN